MFTRMFMNKFNKLPFLEADGGGAGGSGGSGGADGGTGGQGQKAEIDYDKIADILAGKQKVNEENVLKGYFKGKGLSKEEVEQAIAAFKETQAKNKPDIAAIQKQASDAQAAALQAQMERDAMLLAGDIGVDLKTMPYVLKMADLTEAVAEGKVNNEKLKAALQKVLEDVPSLKANVDSNQGHGFRFGADNGGGNPDATEDALDRIFGVKKK